MAAVASMGPMAAVPCIPVIGGRFDGFVAQGEVYQAANTQSTWLGRTPSEKIYSRTLDEFAEAENPFQTTIRDAHPERHISAMVG